MTLTINGKVKPEAPPKDADDMVKRLISGANPKDFSPLTQAVLLRHPLSGSTLKLVAERVSRGLVAAAIGISASNLSKLYKRELSQTQSEEVVSLTTLWAELKEFFGGDMEMLNSWLDEPVPALEGTPRSLMSTFAGRRAIETYLDRVRYGDYSF